MSLNTQRRGGARPGAGRPKKKARDYQKTHSIRATDTHWKLIQTAVRIIKSQQHLKEANVLILNDEDFASANRFLIEGVIEKYHDSMWTPPAPPAMQPVEKTVQTPVTSDEEKAVSLFLEYFRINPVEATSLIKSRLEKEVRIRRAKERRQREAELIKKLDKETQDVFSQVDDINERVARMLRF